MLQDASSLIRLGAPVIPAGLGGNPVSFGCQPQIYDTRFPPNPAGTTVLSFACNPQFSNPQLAQISLALFKDSCDCRKIGVANRWEINYN
ncbi:hypothetical protein AAKU67_000037 [Oxalobacteraceae bacterium GrIS 2.11]